MSNGCGGRRRVELVVRVITRALTEVGFCGAVFSPFAYWCGHTNITGGPIDGEESVPEIH